MELNMKSSDDGANWNITNIDFSKLSAKLLRDIIITAAPNARSRDITDYVGPLFIDIYAINPDRVEIWVKDPLFRKTLLRTLRCMHQNITTPTRFCIEIYASPRRMQSLHIWCASMSGTNFHVCPDCLRKLDSPEICSFAGRPKTFCSLCMLFCRAYVVDLYGKPYENAKEIYKTNREFILGGNHE